MITPPIPANETERLNKLYEYSLLDTMNEEEYDQITKMAALLCEVPISLISLIDRDRQWFKSKVGLEDDEGARDEAFCAHAINNIHEPLIVEDSSEDERFHDNPYVTGDPNIGFYAGIPLVTDDEMALGTLCVIDRKPRELSKSQLESLKILANQVVKLFELRKASLLMERYNKDLEARNKSLEEFARVAAHDIKSPLGSIKATAQMIKDQPGNLNEEQIELLGLMEESSEQLSQLIEGILRHSRSNELILEEKSWFSLPDLAQGCLRMLEPLNEGKLKLEVADGLNKVYSNRTAWHQIIINLVANAIKYTIGDQPKIKVQLKAEGNYLVLCVKDNGPGIKESDQERIFKLFQTTGNKDRGGKTGSGIGLATVKSIVDGMGGGIELKSTLGEGSAFTVRIPVV